MLLLYGNHWGLKGENSILESKNEGGDVILLSAVQKLQEVYNSFPSWVLASLKKIDASQTILRDTGKVDNTKTADPLDETMAMIETEAELDDQGDLLPEYGGYDFEDDDEDGGVDDDGTPTLKSNNRSGLRDFTTYNVPADQMKYLEKYIRTVHNKHLRKLSKENKLSSSERVQKEQNKQLRFKFTDHDEKEVKHLEMLKTLNPLQKHAYEIANNKLLNFNKNGTSLFMFISGEGGTGKSHLIKCLSLSMQLSVGKTIGSWGPLAIMAPTGTAAHNVNGHTWQSMLGKSRADNDIRGGGMVKMPPEATKNIRKNSEGCIGLLLDEASLLSEEDIDQINQRCQIARENKLLFGGLHVILFGDFHQMQSVKGTDLAKIPFGAFNMATNNPACRGFRVWRQLNAYVELKTNVRAATIGGGQLSPLAFFNQHARLADFSDPRVLATINTRVGKNLSSILSEIDDDKTQIVYICSTHAKIAAVNKLFLERAIKKGITIHRIIAQHNPTKSNVPTPTTQILNMLYNIEGGPGSRKNHEGSCSLPSYLDMFVGQRVRVDRNLSVPLGITNGAMGDVVGFVYSGDIPAYILNKQPPPTNFSKLTENERKPPIVLVRLDHPPDYKAPYTCVGDPNYMNVFPFSLVSGHCTSIPSSNDKGGAGGGKNRMEDRYSRKQVPLLVAHGRTTHSTQGMTFFYKVIVDPDNQFYAGVYVSISRATDINNVHLISPLTTHHFQKNEDFRNIVNEEYKRLRILFPQLEEEIVIAYK